MRSFKRSVTCALVLQVGALALAPVRIARPTTARGPLASRTRPLASSPLSDGDGASDAAAPRVLVTPPPSAKSPLARARSWFASTTSISKDDLMKYGTAGIFSYGLISNVNAMLLVAFTWSTYRRANPLLSPIAEGGTFLNPASWFPLKKQFLGYYAAYYLSIGSILRPFRAALALAVTPKVDATWTRIQERLKVPRAVAIGIFVAVFNVIGAFVLLYAAVSGFCLALRVPPLP